jgi:hypothetical protein
VARGKRTHGAEGVKEHYAEPGDAAGLLAALVLQCYLIHTTLGNGYLGSRIDEERSEMRYLV